jgi:hypothetical protein
MHNFYIWSGETRVAPNEIIRAIEIPREHTTNTQCFEKIAGWDGDFADASVAVANLGGIETRLCPHFPGGGRTTANPRKSERKGTIGWRSIRNGYPNRSTYDS